MTKSRLLAIFYMGILPIVFYFVFFCAMTYPAIKHVATDCFCDTGDGYQYVWDLWWVNKAITDLHQSPWETTYLYYPTGLPLVIHDLDTLNGLIGIGLVPFIALPQIYNVLIIVGFVLSGLTMFWLAYHLTRSYSASLLAGFIFTFSNYHFAQTIMSHLTVVTMYWLPLFVLCWILFLEKPTLRRAAYAAIILWALTLTHLYLMFYAILIGAMTALWSLAKHRDLLLFFRREYLRPTLVFITLSLVVLGPFLGSYLLISRNDPMLVDPFGTNNATGHVAADYSVDVLALFIPAGRTGNALLSRLAGFSVQYTYAEHNAYPGLLVWGLLILVAIRWRSAKAENLTLWYFMLIIFILISFGPVLHLGGAEISGIPMPYSLLEKVVPLFGSSGVPGRIIVMSILCAAIISAFGFRMLFQNYVDRPAVIGAIMVGILIILTLDYLPLPLTITPPNVPAYVQILRDLPGHDGLIDGLTPAAVSMYYQTIHQKPLAFSYTSRVTQSASDVAKKYQALLVNRDYATLCRDYDYKYLVTKPTDDVIEKMPSARQLYVDPFLALYDLGCAPS